MASPRGGEAPCRERCGEKGEERSKLRACLLQVAAGGKEEEKDAGSFALRQVLATGKGMKAPLTSSSTREARRPKGRRSS